MAIPAFRIFALACVALALKMFAVSWWTGYLRGRHKSAATPEDRGGGSETEHPAVARALRAHRNDLENIPIFFILGLLYAMAGAGATAMLIYCAVFVGARVLHTVFYLASIQPWRSVAWGIGQAASLGLMVQIVLRALRA